MIYEVEVGMFVKANDEADALERVGRTIMPYANQLDTENEASIAIVATYEEDSM